MNHLGDAAPVVHDVEPAVCRLQGEPVSPVQRAPDGEKHSATGAARPRHHDGLVLEGAELQSPDLGTLGSLGGDAGLDKPSWHHTGQPALWRQCPGCHH